MTPTTAADPTEWKGAAAGSGRRAPGRPRSARAEQAIIDAVLAMLAEGTAMEALSVESVAARAGVGKATIYRRWPSKEELVVEAVASVKLPLPQLSGCSVRADLITLVRASGHGSDQQKGLMSCLLSQLARSPELHGQYQRMVKPRRECVREVLRRGIANGELRADLDVEVTLALLAAPMIMQRMVCWNPSLAVPDLPERIVDAVLAGAARP